MTPEQAIEFLNEAARYFERRAGFAGEDSAHWSDTYNADNCRKIASLIELLKTSKQT